MKNFYRTLLRFFGVIERFTAADVVVVDGSWEKSTLVRKITGLPFHWVIFALKNTRAQSAKESFCICADLTTFTTMWQQPCDTILT